MNAIPNFQNDLSAIINKDSNDDLVILIALPSKPTASSLRLRVDGVNLRGSAIKIAKSTFESVLVLNGWTDFLVFLTDQFVFGSAVFVHTKS